MFRRRDDDHTPRGRRSLNSRLKIVLAIWAVAYPVVACGPMVITEGGFSGMIGNFIGLTLGGLLFVPWLVGIVVLGALVWVTSPRRYGG